MDNFSYLVYCPATGKGLGVDPSFEPEELAGGGPQARGDAGDPGQHPRPPRPHRRQRACSFESTGAKLAAHPLDVPGADIPLEEGSVLQVGEGAVEVLHTPGHTPGSVTLHPPGALITGDTLFVTFVGRADLSGSDPEALYRSLRRLAAFPPETTVYPGHDYGPRPVSTIAFELENNSYLRCPDLESFLKLRMG